MDDMVSTLDSCDSCGELIPVDERCVDTEFYMICHRCNNCTKHSYSHGTSAE